MTQAHTYLVPTDFSDGSRRAIDRALALASESGAEVVLLSVFDLPVYATPLGGAPDSAAMAAPEAFVRSVREGLQRDLDTLVAELSGGAVTVRGRVAEGMAAATIVRIAEELDADMIILGTHGRTGFQRFMLGSVAERVVRTAGRPVMTIPLPAP